MISQNLLIEIIGWAGAFCVLLAYFLLSAKKLVGDSYAYQGLNILGAACIAIYTLWKGALASVFVNVIWAAIGLYAVFNIWRANRKTQN